MIVVVQHGGGEGLGEGQEEVNTQGEVVRQKEYLERTLLSLKNQLSQAGAEGPNHLWRIFTKSLSLFILLVLLVCKRCLGLRCLKCKFTILLNLLLF